MSSQVTRKAVPFRVVVGLTVVVVVVVGLLVRAALRQDDGPSGAPDGATDTSGSSESTSGTPSSTPVVPVRRDRLRPPPASAPKDRPELYADGCQVDQVDDRLTGCAYGASAEEATATIAVVGDSKSGQWTTPLQRLARTRGWRILIYTKSACAPVAVPVSKGGAEYESCTRYNRRVSAELVARPVDLVLASSSSDAGFVADELGPGENAGEVSLDTFVEGEKQAWTTWIKAGNRVAVISDIPRPIGPDGVAFDVPRCVLRNQDYLDACSFDRAEGEALSGRPGQVRGIEAMGAVDVSPALEGEAVPEAADAPLAWIDPLHLICPGERCLPTDGEVLVYREGSHLTDTYVTSLTDSIGAVMTELGLP